jgi:F0F1-type ATP synthase delta subunit
MKRLQLIEVSTAFTFNLQKYINSKAKELNAREIRLVISVDPNLIGGF